MNDSLEVRRSRASLVGAAGGGRDDKLTLDQHPTSFLQRWTPSTLHSATSPPPLQLPHILSSPLLDLDLSQARLELQEELEEWRASA